MKYISLLMMLTFMKWTWSLTHDDRMVSESTHVVIQNDLRKIIKEYIEQNLPNARNLKFEKFWTQTMNSEQVKASFIYSFEDTGEKSGNTRVEVEGNAILNKGSKNESEIETWNFDELYILNNKVEFQDPMTVNLNDESDDE